MISMYTHQCCSRSTLDIAGTLLALSYIFCVYRLGCWENPPPLPQGGGNHLAGGGGGCGVPAHIYIYMQYRLNVKLKCFLLCHLWQVLFAPSWGYESLESLYEERWEGPKHAHPKSCWWHTATQTDRTTVPQDAKDEENAADGMEKLQKQMLWWHGYEWIHSLVIVLANLAVSTCQVAKRTWILESPHGSSSGSVR